MSRVLLILFAILVFVPNLKAQELSLPQPIASPESHSYTYNVKEDGTASAWLRVDSVTMPLAGGEYKLMLPANVEGEVMGWYRENACPQYVDNVCTWYGSNPWYQAEITRDGNKITLKIPKRSVAKRDENVALSLGLIYGVSDVTKKTWWGREVTVASVTPEQFVSYVSIGVYLPDGVYARDKQSGPSGWNEALSQMSMTREAAPTYDAKMGASMLLDSAGSGQIYRYRQNLAPGEVYSFNFMSSTSKWKLFFQEIVTTLIWVVGIALVLSLLMYLVVGKRPWWWYCLVTLLLVLLFVLILGLWISFRFGLSDGGRGGYPVTMEKSVAL